jgi:uncharacterized protein YdcH (DUF465 family)
LLPERCCTGCVLNAQIAFCNFLEEHSDLSDKITFIYSNEKLANKELITRLESYYDEHHSMDDNIPAVLFGIGNFTIVETRKAKVKQVMSIDLDELEIIESYLFDFFIKYKDD